MIVIHRIVKSALTELADEDYQRRVWFGTGDDEVSSLTECTCQLFDDSGLGAALDRNVSVYGSAADDDLRTLGGFLTLMDDASPQETLSDPLLSDARALATVILERVGWAL